MCESRINALPYPFGSNAGVRSPKRCSCPAPPRARRTVGLASSANLAPMRCVRLMHDGGPGSVRIFTPARERSPPKSDAYGASGAYTAVYWSNWSSLTSLGVRKISDHLGSGGSHAHTRRRHRHACFSVLTSRYTLRGWIDIFEIVQIGTRYIPDPSLKRQIPGGAPPPIYG